MKLFPTKINAFEGKEITLACQNEGSEKFRWNECRWTRESDDATCFFESKITGSSSSSEVYQVCNGSLDSSKIEFIGFKSPRTICGIKFRTLFKQDEGRWRCNMDYYDVPSVGYCTAKRAIYAKVGNKQLLDIEWVSLYQECPVFRKFLDSLFTMKMFVWYFRWKKFHSLLTQFRKWK